MEQSSLIFCLGAGTIEFMATENKEKSFKKFTIEVQQFFSKLAF